MSTAKQHEEDLQRLAQLRPIDDDLMRCLLKDNIPLAELDRKSVRVGKEC